MSPHVSVFGLNSKEDTIPRPTCDAEVIPSAKGDREALIIYTSGTTGRPKGCIISNTSCLAAGESYGEAGGLINFEPGKDRLYIPLPAFSHERVSLYSKHDHQAKELYRPSGSFSVHQLGGQIFITLKRPVYIIWV